MPFHASENLFVEPAQNISVVKVVSHFEKKKIGSTHDGINMNREG